MNSWRAGFAAFLFLSASPALLAESSAPAGIPSVEAVWMKAMRANDLEGVLACYDRDAVLWTINEAEARGEKAIRTSYADFLSANMVRSVEVSNAGHRTAGNWAAGWGNFKLTIAPKAGGKPVTITGRFTEVVEKKNGRWVYVVDHASADPAPVAAPAK